MSHVILRRRKPGHESSDLKQSGGRFREWKFAVGGTVISIYWLFFMEWLFFVTKPSFLSTLSWKDSLVVLSVAPLCFGVAWVVLASLLLVLPLGRRALVVLACLGPALVLALSGMLLVDNFMLTVWGVGIRSVRGVWAIGLVDVLLVLLMAACYRSVRRLHGRLQGSRTPVYVAAGLLGFSLIGLGFKGSSQPAVSTPDRISSGERPFNVLILSSDGLDADHMSVYGYQRQTTPFLNQFASETLLCENAFSNSTRTAGSLISLLTGKLPTQTRVFYPPDILRGKDIYEHFPLLLRNRGYRSIHLSMRHYADVYDFNLLESFDSSNFRAGPELQIPRVLTRLVGPETAYFDVQVVNRIEGRLLHLGHWRPMEDVYAEVSGPRRTYRRDSELWRGLYAFLESTTPPFFAQVHLMGTHGKTFRPSDPLFSKGQTQERDWMVDFYDDAIRDFDSGLKELVEWLKRRNLLEETVLVIHSDHSQRYRFNVRIPLIIRFPGSKPSGRVSANTQNLDIAPTITDFLGIPTPDWMQGRSLISSSLDPLHPVLVATLGAGTIVREEGREIDLSRVGPPFFALGGLGAIICNRTFFWRLQTNTVAQGTVPRHTAPCDANQTPSLEAIRLELRAHLAENGYDVSSLEQAPGADIEQQILNLVEELQSRGMEKPQIQELAWEIFGARVIVLFNQRDKHEPLPRWMTEVVDWAFENGKVLYDPPGPNSRLREISN